MTTRKQYQGDGAEQNIHDKKFWTPDPTDKNQAVLLDIINQITVTCRENEVFYNQSTSPHQAIVQIEPGIKELPFAKQMVLTLCIWNALLVRQVKNASRETYIYSFFKENDALEMCVLNQRTGKIALHVNGLEMISKGYMNNEVDVAGLGRYLVSVGSMKSTDSLVYNSAI